MYPSHHGRFRCCVEDGKDGICYTGGNELGSSLTFYVWNPAIITVKPMDLETPYVLIVGVKLKKVDYVLE